MEHGSFLDDLDDLQDIPKSDIPIYLLEIVIFHMLNY